MSEDEEKIEDCQKVCEHFVKLAKNTDLLLLKDVFFFKKEIKKEEEEEEEKPVDLNKLDDFELFFEIGKRKLKQLTETLSDENLNTYFFQASCEQRCESKYNKKMRECIKNAKTFQKANNCFKNTDL